MNDHDLENRLRAAQRAEGEQADPGALTERVLSIPETVEPQRRRLWHGFRLGARRGADAGGGTMKGGPLMFSTMRTAAVIAVLALTGTFALSGMFGPDSEPIVPAAQTPAEAGWVTVTGTETFACAYAECSSQDVMSDPRVSGEGLVSWESREETSSSMTDYSLWGEYNVTNEGGAWDGEWIGFVDQDGRHHITWWLRGSGDYEGLTYLATAEQQPDGVLDVTGLISPGDIPPTVAMGMRDEPST